MRKLIILALFFSYSVFPDATFLKNGNQIDTVPPRFTFFPISSFNNFSFLNPSLKLENEAEDTELDEFEAFKLYSYTTLFGVSSQVILSSPIHSENQRKELKQGENSTNKSSNSYFTNIFESNSTSANKLNVNLGFDKSAFQNPYLITFDINKHIRWDISLEFKY